MGFSLAAARLLRLRVLLSICFSLLMFPRPCVPMLLRLQSDPQPFRPRSLLAALTELPGPPVPSLLCVPDPLPGPAAFCVRLWSYSGLCRGFCFCTSLTRLHPASHAPHGTADQMFHLALHQVWVGLGQGLGFPALVPACPTLPSLSSSKPTVIGR